MIMWRISGRLYRLFCRGQAKVDKKDLVQLKGLTTDIAECEEFSRQQGGELFHWYQPGQDAPGSAGYTGKRACEVVKSWPNPRELVPLRTKDTYLAVIPFSGPGDVTVHGELNSEVLDQVREEALEEVLEEAYEEVHEEV
ncbi:hypothetical protein V490_07146 [Pseudogymnoascus sp. VKM F-3557]|nr:hypothetical protein V490_07146 [Pseudogymnoascus sp. VKM F-3557]